MARLSAGDRRREILSRTMAVFAQKGFEAATSKELASAAGVSEALLYRYFPTKADLYAGLTELLEEGKERIVNLVTQRPADAEGFIYGFYVLARIVLEGPPHRGKDDSIDRLMGQSLLGDGAFAEAFLNNMFNPLVPYFSACLNEAEQQGQVVRDAGDPATRSVLMHHFIGTIALFSLPTPQLLPFKTSRERLESVLRFAFRGVGFREEALVAHLDFERLDQAFHQALGGPR